MFITFISVQSSFGWMDDHLFIHSLVKTSELFPVLAMNEQKYTCTTFVFGKCLLRTITETADVFLKVATPFCILTSNGWEFQVLQILTNI